MEPDVIVIGAGFAGAVIAERFASSGKRVTIIEQKAHTGGHAYDFFDEDGVLIHKYGPHIFHTNNKAVMEYLSDFTEWLPYQHRVLTHIDGKKVPMPFNLNTLYAVFPPQLAARLENLLIKHFGYGKKIPVLQLKKEATMIGEEELAMLADFVFEKAFLNYTRKQWGVEPEALIGVLERVPILLSRDDRYFHDKYQFLPAKGYHTLFENLLKSERIEVRLDTTAKDVVQVDLKTGEITFDGASWQGILVYTGRIDAFFDEKYGKLPYRSLVFKERIVPQERYQDVPVENYPNTFDFTRITEYKLFYPSKSTGRTKIFEEFSVAYDGTTPPYYPIPMKENQELYKRYREAAERLNKETKNTFLFIGRLAEYRYYNMDGAIARALEVSKRFSE